MKYPVATIQYLGNNNNKTFKLERERNNSYVHENKGLMHWLFSFNHSEHVYMDSTAIAKTSIAIPSTFHAKQCEIFDIDRSYFSLRFEATLSLMKKTNINQSEKAKKKIQLHGRIVFNLHRARATACPCYIRVRKES